MLGREVKLQMRVFESHLDIMLRKLLGQRSSSVGGRVNSIVNGNLSIFMVEPGVNIFSALLQDLLAQNDRGRRGIGEEVVVRNGSIRADGGSPVIAEMEYTSLDS